VRLNYNSFLENKWYKLGSHTLTTPYDTSKRGRQVTCRRFALHYLPGGGGEGGGNNFHHRKKLVCLKFFYVHLYILNRIIRTQIAESLDLGNTVVDEGGNAEVLLLVRLRLLIILQRLVGGGQVCACAYLRRPVNQSRGNAQVRLQRMVRLKKSSLRWLQYLPFHSHEDVQTGFQDSFNGRQFAQIG
jgi:hypothetical protein